MKKPLKSLNLGQKHKTISHGDISSTELPSPVSILSANVKTNASLSLFSCKMPQWVIKETQFCCSSPSAAIMLKRCNHLYTAASYNFW